MYEAADNGDTNAIERVNDNLEDGLIKDLVSHSGGRKYYVDLEIAKFYLSTYEGAYHADMPRLTRTFEAIMKEAGHL